MKQKIIKKTKKPEEIKELPAKDLEAANKRASRIVDGLMLPRNVVMQIADEVVKVVNQRLIRRTTTASKKSEKQKIAYPIFLDTSAIIDGRVFDLMRIGVFNGTFIVIDGVLSELKSIADSKDSVKKERGRKGLKMLDEIKKQKGIELKVIKDTIKDTAVDDQIVAIAKDYKGKIVTCDYNLSKKATISGVVSIDMYELATILKTAAVPGEEFFIKVIQKGKGEGQGVGYLPDGTMIVVEKGEGLIGTTVRVVVSRIIQTDAGKIFFAKLIDGEAVMQ